MPRHAMPASIGIIILPVAGGEWSETANYRSASKKFHIDTEPEEASLSTKCGMSYDCKV